MKAQLFQEDLYLSCKSPIDGFITKLHSKYNSDSSEVEVTYRKVTLVEGKLSLGLEVVETMPVSVEKLKEINYQYLEQMRLMGFD